MSSGTGQGPPDPCPDGPSERTQRRGRAGTSRPGPASDGGDQAEASPAKVQKVAELKAGGKSTSAYRGVTKHKRSGRTDSCSKTSALARSETRRRERGCRWEARIWVGNETNKQIYLGGYETEELAAEAHDVAVLKTKGFSAHTNFSKDRYKDFGEAIKRCTLEELVSIVRRHSHGFAKGTSSFKGVSFGPSGNFDVRLGVPGSKPIYLRHYESEEEAARVYDRAMLRLRGHNTATNFPVTEYTRQAIEHQLKQLEVNKPTVYQALCHHAFPPVVKEAKTDTQTEAQLQPQLPAQLNTSPAAATSAAAAPNVSELINPALQSFAASTAANAAVEAAVSVLTKVLPASLACGDAVASTPATELTAEALQSAVATVALAAASVGSTASSSTFPQTSAPVPGASSLPPSLALPQQPAAAAGPSTAAAAPAQNAPVVPAAPTLHVLQAALVSQNAQTSYVVQQGPRIAADSQFPGKDASSTSSHNATVGVREGLAGHEPESPPPQLPTGCVSQAKRAVAAAHVGSSIPARKSMVDPGTPRLRVQSFRTKT